MKSEKSNVPIIGFTYLSFSSFGYLDEVKTLMGQNSDGIFHHIKFKRTSCKLWISIMGTIFCTYDSTKNCNMILKSQKL
jgi:hypothetical protein